MRLVYAGTPQLAVPPLEELSRKHEIVCVLTNPDRPSGRGGHTEESAVKIKAAGLGLNIIQPEKIDETLVSYLKSLNPDALAVAAFGTIFRQNFLDVFNGNAFNLHPSLLPVYRGPSPIQAALLSGDSFIGISVQKIVLKMDCGPLAVQERIGLSGSENAQELTERVSSVGAKLLCDVFDRLEQGSLVLSPQDDSRASYCRLIKKSDGKIKWTDSAVQIDRMVRAYYPWPAAWTYYENKKLDILNSVVLTGRADSPLKPGTVIAMDKKEGILIQTGEGILAVKKLKLEAKKELDFKSFINGTRAFINAQLGEKE
jgi:methionyl-tRNA formyltransferase